MEAFYKLKEGMTEQHKKHLIDLKKSYDDSLKNHKREEAEAQERVNKLNEQYQAILADLKTAKTDIEDTLKENIRLTEENEHLKQDKINFYDLKDRTEKDSKDHREQIAKDAEALNNKTVADNARVTAREDQIKKLKKDTDEAIIRNRALLVAIDEKLNQVNAITKSNEDAIDKLADKQTEYREEMAKFEVEKSQHRIKVEKIEADKEDIIRREKIIFDKDTKITDREKKCTIKEQDQRDKGIEQELEDSRLLKIQQRIDNLIEVHKLRGQT